MKSYLLRHIQVFFYSLGQLSQTPFSTLMIVAMLGVSLALPIVLSVVVENASRISAQWEARPQISLFLEKSLDQAAVSQFIEEIESLETISTTRYVAAEQALGEFKQISGFGSALDFLDENPLPAVVIAFPDAKFSAPEQLIQLAQTLESNQEVEVAQVDLEWVQRLQALLSIVQRGIVVLAILLGVGVVLIISNTIRLAIANRREEIDIIDQIGGTHAFIRRPFLYNGMLLGVLGALFACGLTAMLIWLLQGPVTRMSALYASEFKLSGAGLLLNGAIICLSGLLGWLGARLTVWRHLRYLVPK